MVICSYSGLSQESILVEAVGGATEPMVAFLFLPCAAADKRQFNQPGFLAMPHTDLHAVSARQRCDARCYFILSRMTRYPRTNLV